MVTSTPKVHCSTLFGDPDFNAGGGLKISKRISALYFPGYWRETGERLEKRLERDWRRDWRETVSPNVSTLAIQNPQIGLALMCSVSRSFGTYLPTLLRYLPAASSDDAMMML